MRKFISLKLEKNIIDYKSYLDIKYKKLCIIPIINSFKNKLEIIITIKSNIFNKIKICKINEKIINITLINKNLEFYENEIKKVNDYKYPILKKDSVEYKNIEKVYNISKNSSEILQFTSLFISLFNQSFLSKISIYLPTLLLFDFIKNKFWRNHKYFNIIF